MTPKELSENAVRFRFTSKSRQVNTFPPLGPTYDVGLLRTESRSGTKIWGRYLLAARMPQNLAELSLERSGAPVGRIYSSGTCERVVTSFVCFSSKYDTTKKAKKLRARCATWRQKYY